LLRARAEELATVRTYRPDGVDGVVLDEFSQMKPEVWNEVVRPMYGGLV
jgi:hypothetical protein